MEKSIPKACEASDVLRDQRAGDLIKGMSIQGGNLYGKQLFFSPKKKDLYIDYILK